MCLEPAWTLMAAAVIIYVISLTIEQMSSQDILNSPESKIYNIKKRALVIFYLNLRSLRVL